MLKLLLTAAYYEENFFVLQCLAIVVDDSNLRIPWRVTETQKTVSGQSLLFSKSLAAFPKPARPPFQALTILPTLLLVTSYYPMHYPIDSSVLFKHDEIPILSTPSQQKASRLLKFQMLGFPHPCPHP